MPLAYRDVVDHIGYPRNPPCVFANSTLEELVGHGSVERHGACVTVNLDLQVAGEEIVVLDSSANEIFDLFVAGNPSGRSLWSYSDGPCLRP